MILGKRKIEKYGKEIFFILEAGTNFYEHADLNGISLLDAAKEFIDKAEELEADAIKFQAYKTETLVSKKFAKEQYYYTRRHDALDYEDYIELIEHTKDKPIEFMVTLFDEEGIEVLGKYLNIFKIASPDIIHKQLIKKIDEFGKSIIMSTGFATTEEIKQAIEWANNSDVILLHCIPKYPTKHVEELNLARIRKLNAEFSNIIGYSDHSVKDDGNTFSNLSTNALDSAVMLGANVIEKHFKLMDTQMNDGAHSITPEMAEITIKNVRRYTRERGLFVNKDFLGNLDMINFLSKARRGLYAGRDYTAGEKIDEVKFLRPTNFMTADRVDEVIGKVVNRNIKDGEPLSPELWLKK